MYSIVKPFLFLLSAERAHYFTTGLLGFLFVIPGLKVLFKAIYCPQKINSPVVIAGLKFQNQVGLAAGFDKNASLLGRMSALGFGHVEIGTVTPKGQPGNPKPRLFRLKKDEGLINRMGFNNKGVSAAAVRLNKFKKKGLIVGGNIGKNKVTPNDEAHLDYQICAETLYEFIDYFVVNVSSPNTPGLRELQGKSELSKILNTVLDTMEKKVRKPVFLKIAPDLNEDELLDVVSVVKDCGVDGIIATNTTISREGLTTTSEELNAIGAGGLSGRPVQQRATEVIAFLRKAAGPELAIIGVGGILSGADALEKINAGADLVQVYSGLIYRGPSLIKEINKTLAAKAN